MRETTRWTVDAWLRKRAKWMVEEAGVVRELFPKVTFDGDEAKGPTILFVGAGKGHEMEEVERLIPAPKLIGIDPHDHHAPPVEARLKELGADAAYLHESVRAEDMREIPDGSVDGLTLFFVLHHVEDAQHDQVMSETRRVLKPDGRVFVAEDLVDNEAEQKITERADRLINVELVDGPHHYRSKAQWEAYFDRHGFEAVRSHEVKPGKVRHGFFTLRPKWPVDGADSKA